MRVQEAEPRADTTLGDELVASLTEGFAILCGEAVPARYHPVPASIDVRAIRQKLGLSQGAFAQRFGFGVATVRDWEQGRSRPDQAARSYLLVIEREPEAVERALHQAAA